MTVTELLERWKGRSKAFDRMAHQDYGADSPEKNMMIMSMNKDLKQCIMELEALIHGDPLKHAMSKIITNRLESE